MLTLVSCLQTVRLQGLRDSAATDAAPLRPVFGCGGRDLLLRRRHVHRLPAPPKQGELSKKCLSLRTAPFDIKDDVWTVGGTRS